MKISWGKRREQSGIERRPKVKGNNIKEKI